MLTRIFHIALIAASAMTLSAAPAASVVSDETGQTVVRYDDLDLSSPAGAKAMFQRIEAAARSACGPEQADRLSFRRQWTACVRETANRAVVDLQSTGVDAARDAAERA